MAFIPYCDKPPQLLPGAPPVLALAMNPRGILGLNLARQAYAAALPRGIAAAIAAADVELRPIGLAGLPAVHRWIDEQPGNLAMFPPRTAKAERRAA